MSCISIRITLRWLFCFKQRTQTGAPGHGERRAARPCFRKRKKKRARLKERERGLKGLPLCVKVSGSASLRENGGFRLTLRERRQVPVEERASARARLTRLRSAAEALGCAATSTAHELALVLQSRAGARADADADEDVALRDGPVAAWVLGVPVSLSPASRWGCLLLFLLKKTQGDPLFSLSQRCDSAPGGGELFARRGGRVLPRRVRDGPLAPRGALGRRGRRRPGRLQSRTGRLSALQVGQSQRRLRRKPPPLHRPRLQHALRQRKLHAPGRARRRAASTRGAKLAFAKREYFPRFFAGFLRGYRTKRGLVQFKRTPKKQTYKVFRERERRAALPRDVARDTGALHHGA